MTSRVIWTLSALAIAASVQLPAQTNRELAWTAQTPRGDPELQGEWTTEGEYGVPLLFAFVAFIAAFFPMRRALSVDLTIALRCE